MNVITAIVQVVILFIMFIMANSAVIRVYSCSFVVRGSFFVVQTRRSVAKDILESNDHCQ
jgi:hypothetical protein